MKTFTDYLHEATKDNNGKIKIVAIQGSPRTKESCSGGDSKTAYIMNKALQELTKDIQVTVLDLKVIDTDPQVKPCKGCISTSNGFHCHYPCSCYSKDDGTNDFMYEEDVYKKMEEADGFIVFTPVHWSAPSTQVKALFDRLVCVNLTLSVDEAKKLMGDKYKDPTTTKAMELSGKHRDQLKNHYEGKVGAFFIHGDNGANDYVDRRIPLSLAEFKQDDSIDPKQAIMPIVNQCRYSGIFVPENCIAGPTIGYKKPYALNNKEFKNTDVVEQATKLLETLVAEIKKRRT
jgi:multimeric flavodoxin WrbA